LTTNTGQPRAHLSGKKAPSTPPRVSRKRTKSDAQKRKFQKLVKGLNDLLDEVRKTTPKANYYLAEDSFHLMVDESHDLSGRKQQQNSADQAYLAHSGGGDW
jgi:hypothetical protein